MEKHGSVGAKIFLRAIFAVIAGAGLACAHAATITVNSLADDVFDVAGSWAGAASAGKCTLRMAIAAANTDTAIGGAGGCAAGSGPDTITFAASLNLATTPGTIVVADVAMSTNPATLPAAVTNPPPLFVARALTISGPGSGQLTLDGSLAAVSGRRIIAAADFDDTVVFPFTLTGIRLLRGRVLDGQGGCMAISETLTLNDVVFESCEAVSGANNSGVGGALSAGVDSTVASNPRPDISIVNSRFIGNRATHGSSVNRSEAGAATLGGNGDMVGNVVITNTAFNGNSADTRGALLLVDATSVAISGSHFVGNAAVGPTGGHGGLLINFVAGDVTINNASRIVGNVANGQRGGLGISTVGGTVTLNQVDISGNYVNNGGMGGVDIITDETDNTGACTGNSLRPVNLTNVRIQGNSAATSQGGIRVTCSGAVTLTDVDIIGNETRGYQLTPSATVPSSNSAGTFFGSSFPQSTVSFNRVLIQGNSTNVTIPGGQAPVIRLNNLNAFTADGLRFRNNYSGASTGLWMSAGGAGRTYLVSNSEFSGNSADDAPTIYVDTDGAYTIRNTTVSGNTARTGGIIKAFTVGSAPGAFQLSVEHSTIARNVAPGPEAFSLGSAGGPNPQIAFRNTILGSRTYGYTASPVVSIDPSVTNVVTDHSLLEWTGGAPATFCSGAGMKCNVSGMVSPLANNGGTSDVGTMALLAGSPAINAGGAVTGGLTTDARGTGFPRVVGSAVDIGAFESAPASTTGCTLDVDGNGSTDALTDGLMVIRALFGLTGTAVTNGALGATPTRNNWNAIRTYLNANCGTSFLP